LQHFLQLSSRGPQEKISRAVCCAGLFYNNSFPRNAAALSDASSISLSGPCIELLSSFNLPKVSHKQANLIKYLFCR